MSKCKACFNRRDSRCKVLQRPTAGACPACAPEEVVSPAEDACVCPPIGEPKLLTTLAPVVFDECGINICRTIEDLRDLVDENGKCKRSDSNGDSLEIVSDEFDFDDVVALEVRVIDIDFNVDEDTVRVLDRRPNCVRVRLEDITVVFSVKFLDDRCDVIGEGILTLEYLPDDPEDPDFDDETNRPFAIDLYVPYGVSYNNDFVDTINFLGFLRSNNALRQGIVAQALAKVVAFDSTDFIVAIGVTIYLKAVYFVQYKLQHCGLAVPPKCIPADVEAIDACQNFVEGNLLEQNIQPLEVACHSKTTPKCHIPVVDPTPAENCCTK